MDTSDRALIDSTLMRLSEKVAGRSANAKTEKLHQAIDTLKGRFGENAIRRSTVIQGKN